MGPAEFAAYHEAALAFDEVRYGAVLSILMQARQGTLAGFMHWTLGGPGQCALTAAHRSLFLGALDKSQCRTLAELTARVDYRGVIGADSTAIWLVDRAMELGLRFRDPVPQQIHSISGKPRYPGLPGHARPVMAPDSTLFVDWMMAFQREAVPHNRPQTREELERIAAEGRFRFWSDKEQPDCADAVMPTRSRPPWLNGSTRRGERPPASTRACEIPSRTGATRESGSSRFAHRCSSIDAVSGQRNETG